MNPFGTNVLTLTGRVLIALIFVISGFGKLTAFSGTVGYTASLGVPMPEVATAITVALELLGGLAIVAGWRVRTVATVFALWLIPVTLLAHNPFTADAAHQQAQMINLLKNAAILGAMLLLAAHGAGAWSLDGARGKKA